MCRNGKNSGKIGLGMLIGRFQERMEPDIVLAMTDGQLTRLGISIMGDCLQQGMLVDLQVDILMARL